MRNLLSLILCWNTVFLATRLAVAEPAAPYPAGRAFPLQVYEAYAPNVPALAAHGWNIFQSYGLATASAGSVYLTALKTAGVGGMAPIPSSGPKTNKLEWPREQASAWIGQWASNASLSWWDLPEEMRPWSSREMKVLADYTAWTRLDDALRRPTYEYTPNNRNAAQISQITPNVDVLGISCYCEEMQMPHAWVRYKIEEVGLHGIELAGAVVGQDYLHGQKNPIGILYCAKFSKTGQKPAPDQTYHDFWSAVASGARGIGVYAYFHAMRDDPALKENFDRLNQAAEEISGPEKIGDAVLWGKPVSGVSCDVLSGPDKTVSFRPPNEKRTFQYPSIHLLTKENNGELLIIAVNSTDTNVTARLSGIPIGHASARLPFEKRTLDFIDGAVTDTFPPWGVHIYKVKEL
jgi:hypothetical protein